MRLLLRLFIFCLYTASSCSATASDERISFSFNQEELVNVITYVATKKGINILLPTKQDDKVTGTVTWHLDEKISVEKAWNLLQTILSIAGYSIIPYPTYHEVIKNSPAISREPVPLYVGVPFEALPATDARIRYMHPLANIKSEGQEGESEVLTVLKAWLPSNAVYRIDPASNMLIIMAQSNDIRGIMPVITSLDRPGFQEKMEIIQLQHTQARTIADLFNNKIMQSNEGNRYRLDTKKPSESMFFSKHLKIVANERRNNLIVLGRPQAIDRTRNFIKNYLDVAQDTGKSVLHTYNLQYLNAADFAKVLESVLLQKQTGGTEQSTAGRQTAVGPQRYFDEVIIAVDTPESAGIASGDQEGGGAESAFYGGNTLIVACRNDDWKRIEALIGKLDQPSPQVLIEVLITDLTLDDSRALGTALRNPEKIPMAGDTAFQSAHLSPGVMVKTLGDGTGPPDDISNTVGFITDQKGDPSSADMLRTYGVTSEGVRIQDGADSIASGLVAGSTVLSFNDNDGKTWGITQIVKLLDHSKILSHPHIISTSDKKATIKISETRLLQGPASGSAGGNVVAARQDVEAKLLVEITPRIALSDDKENAVNLQVVIDIDQFKSASDDTRNTRNVTTNVTINTGDILALGGLIRSNEQDSQTETPVLAKIPLIGWLFKKRSKTKQRTNLTVFISPTVILPRNREGMHEYTKDYLGITRTMAKEGGMFDSLKDPITRWFFADQKSPTEEFSENFIRKDERFHATPMPQADLNPTKPPKNLPESTSLFVQQSKDEHDQLKKMFDEVDNPFIGLQPDALAQGDNKKEIDAIAPKKDTHRPARR
ncbi:hypothetical protein ACFLXW_00605 [Candidatus Dependentiae bacterium]